MGYKLYREVMDYAPGTLTHREKLLALAMADDANEHTRVTWNTPYDPKIMRRAMLTSKEQVKKVLRKLKSARVVKSLGHAHNGNEAKFQILHLAPVEAVDEQPTGLGEGPNRSPFYEGQDGKGGKISPPSGPNRPLSSAGRGAKLAPPTPLKNTPLSSSSPHGVEAEAPAPRTPHQDDEEKVDEGKSHNPNQRATALVASRLGCTSDEADRVVRLIIAEHTIRTTPLTYIRGVPVEDLRDHLDTVRDQAATNQAALQDAAVRAFLDEVERAKANPGTPTCDHGTPIGNRLHPATGKPHCPQCRIAADPTHPPLMVMLNGGRSGRPRQDVLAPVHLTTTEAAQDLLKQARARLAQVNAAPLDKKTRTPRDAVS